jgi:hypothetical protein
MKKVLSIFLSLAMAMSLMAAPASAYFNDTVNHSNADAIEVLNTLGIVNGYSEDEFGPDDELTRAQICAIMVRAMTDDISKTYNDTFTDVPYNHYFRAEIDTAYHMGIMNGYGDGKFGPDDFVNYNGMITIMLNALGYNSKILPGSWPENVQKYADKLGFTEGLTITDYTANCTRANACQIIYNAFHKNLVNHNGLAFIETNTTFLNSIGYTERQVAYPDGYEYLTYNDGSKDYKTDVKTSVDYVASFDKDTIAKVNSKDVNFRGASHYFLNGKEVTFDKLGLKNGDKIILTAHIGDDGKFYTEDDAIIAVRFDTIISNTYVPGKLPNAEMKSKVEAMTEYQKGISTVTVVNDKIYISNEYDFGYITSVFTNSDEDVCVKFSNGNMYNVNDIVIMNGTLSDITKDVYATIFFDYMGEPAGFLF